MQDWMGPRAGVDMAANREVPAGKEILVIQSMICHFTKLAPRERIHNSICFDWAQHYVHESRRGGGRKFTYTIMKKLMNETNQITYTNFRLNCFILFLLIAMSIWFLLI
jgi:hypothetical protein